MTDFKKPSFEQMVTDLFKQMPGHGARMLHAALGIAGESGELTLAINRANLLEEAGDMEFYIEAAWQAIASYRQLRETVELACLIDADIKANGPDPRTANITAANVLTNIHTLSADILDNAKKVWVYEDGNRDTILAVLLVRLEVNLNKLYEFVGTTRSYVIEANQLKLLGNDKIKGRYASGVYSNEQALARADKNEAGDTAKSSDRSFLGQSK